MRSRPLVFENAIMACVVNFFKSGNGHSKQLLSIAPRGARGRLHRENKAWNEDLGA